MAPRRRRGRRRRGARGAAPPLPPARRVARLPARRVPHFVAHVAREPPSGRRHLHVRRIVRPTTGVRQAASTPPARPAFAPHRPPRPAPGFRRDLTRFHPSPFRPSAGRLLSVRRRLPIYPLSASCLYDGHLVRRELVGHVANPSQRTNQCQALNQSVPGTDRPANNRACPIHLVYRRAVGDGRACQPIGANQSVPGTDRPANNPACPIHLVYRQAAGDGRAGQPIGARHANQCQALIALLTTVLAQATSFTAEPQATAEPANQSVPGTDRSANNRACPIHLVYRRAAGDGRACQPIGARHTNQCQALIAAPVDRDSTCSRRTRCPSYKRESDQCLALIGLLIGSDWFARHRLAGRPGR
ncbi:MAG: hypothetical protein RLY70_2387, partial [Planctomycetota bacterium]